MGPEVGSPFSRIRPIGNGRTTEAPTNSSFVITRPWVSRPRWRSTTTTATLETTWSVSTTPSNSTSVSSPSSSPATTVSGETSTSAGTTVQPNHRVATTGSTGVVSPTISIVLGVILLTIIVILLVLIVYICRKRRKQHTSRLKTAQNLDLPVASTSSARVSATGKGAELFPHEHNIRPSFSNIEYDEHEGEMYETISELYTPTYDVISFTESYQDLAHCDSNIHIYKGPDLEEYEQPLPACCIGESKAINNKTGLNDHTKADGRSDTTLLIEEGLRFLTTASPPPAVNEDVASGYQQLADSIEGTRVTDPYYSSVDRTSNVYHQIEPPASNNTL